MSIMKRSMSDDEQTLAPTPETDTDAKEAERHRETLLAALRIGESWMKHVIEDTEWCGDAESVAEREKAKAELAKVRAAIAKG